MFFSFKGAVYLEGFAFHWSFWFSKQEKVCFAGGFRPQLELWAFKKKEKVCFSDGGFAFNLSFWSSWTGLYRSFCRDLDFFVSKTHIWVAMVPFGIILTTLGSM